MKHIYLPEEGIILDRDTAHITPIVSNVAQEKGSFFFSGDVIEEHHFYLTDFRVRCLVSRSSFEELKLIWKKLADQIVERDATKATAEINYEVKIDTSEAIKKMNDLGAAILAKGKTKRVLAKAAKIKK